jgi:hypothetical protein
MPVLSSLLLILTLHAGANFTRVNAVQEIRQPFFGCAEKADMEYLIELMNRLPEGSGRAHALAYGHARCIQIPKQIIEIERGDNKFCLRSGIPIAEMPVGSARTDRLHGPGRRCVLTRLRDFGPAGV